jgi:zinc transport system substrate-binding protein
MPLTVVCFLLACLLVFAPMSFLTACDFETGLLGNDKEGENSRAKTAFSSSTIELLTAAPIKGEKLKVVSSVFAAYDFSRELLGEAGEVSLLLKPGLEPHSFEPTVRDILLLQDADVFIYAGGESDVWIDELLSSLETTNLQLIRLIDMVEPLEELELEDLLAARGDDTVDEAGEGQQESTGGLGAAGVAEAAAEAAKVAEAAAEAAKAAEAKQDLDQDLDEHVWTSPKNAKRIVQNLAGIFEKRTPERSALIQENKKDYLGKLDALDERFRTIVQNGKRKTLLFGDRFPFRYLAEEYGLACYAAFPGCSTATETNAKTLSFLIDTVRSEKIPVVFYVELSSHKIADIIAEETGAQPLLLHACHNISLDDFEAGTSYLELMMQNADNLKRALA